ncbi:MAG: HD domain-containing protein [Candidatus Falkowbacteria bacterium]
MGHLARTPRSGFANLLVGKQSVAEHLNRATFVALALASRFEEPIDLNAVLLMILFHDSSETRISDLNYIHQRYVTRHEDKAEADQLRGLPFGPMVKGLLARYHAKDTIEAKIVKDADNLELLLTLRELDQGNPQISYWIDMCLKRVKTQQGQDLAQAIMDTNPWDWWLMAADEKWWIHRESQTT